MVLIEANILATLSTNMMLREVNSSATLFTGMMLYKSIQSYFDARVPVKLFLIVKEMLFHIIDNP